MKKVLFTATVDSHILAFHTPYLKLFKDKGYEVHVATNGDAKIPYCDVKHIVSFERSPFKLNNLRAIKQLKKIVEREEFEIIHTHTPMGSVVTRLAAIKARKKLKTRVIYTAHGFHFFKGAPLQNWAIFYSIEKLLARYTDTLITINKEDYELAKKKFKTQVEYVPGVGIDPKKFDFKMSKAKKTKLRKSLGLKDSDFVMIFPAELNKNKNQILLINAMEQLVKENKNVHLLLPGKDSLGGKYQEIVKELNLSKNIHFLGFRKDIPKLLKISDLAVSSSLREGLPVNIIESMFVGLPVLATSCRGVNDLKHNNKFFTIVAKNDHKMLVDKLKKIVDKDVIENNVSSNFYDLTIGYALACIGNIYWGI
jgi:glycosyltransferase EpsD